MLEPLTAAHDGRAVVDAMGLDPRLRCAGTLLTLCALVQAGERLEMADRARQTGCYLQNNNLLYDPILGLLDEENFTPAPDRLIL